MASDYVVEAVYGQGNDMADELVRFWVDHNALDEATARERAAQVAAVLRDGEGRIVGISSVTATPLPLLGNRNVWLYRNFVPESDRSTENQVKLFNSTRQVMQELLEREGADKAPTGICVILQDEAMARQNPLGKWEESGLVYAGRTRRGFQARIAWLDEPEGWANVHRDLEEGFSIKPVWGEVDQALGDEIVAFWLAEGALEEDVARGRLPEVVQIARDADGALAGICTLEHKQNARLGAPLWYVRIFVSAKYRRSSLAFCLLHSTVDYMQARYDSGEDTRAQGIIMEIENESLRNTAPQGLWAYRRFAYIGDNSRGEHLRIEYFKGAELGF